MRDHVGNGVKQLSRLVMDAATQRGLTSGRKMEWLSDKRSSPLEQAVSPAVHTAGSPGTAAPPAPLPAPNALRSPGSPAEPRQLCPGRTGPHGAREVPLPGL